VAGIILEEISTLSPKMVCHPDTCLRQVTGIDKPFGNLTVLMAGDFGQLGPVEATPTPNAIINWCEHTQSENKTIFICKEMGRQNRQNKNRKKKNPSRKLGSKKSKFSAPSSTQEFKHRCSEGHPSEKALNSQRLPSCSILPLKNVLKTGSTGSMLNPCSGEKNSLSGCSTITKN
jgi:hypothetical protein